LTRIAHHHERKRSIAISKIGPVNPTPILDPFSEQAKKKIELAPKSISLICLLKNINCLPHSYAKPILVAWSNNYHSFLHCPV